MSTLDVVAEILREVAPRALKAREITALAGTRLPTTSRTPETVVSRDLAVDVKTYGAASRFLRVDRGAFVLKEALPTSFYNDVDPYVAQWTRNLIEASHLAPGVVDERSIRDLRPADVASYRQCHFFAGVGTWSRVLRDAGWPDDTTIWSGSCPCQDFSSAGKRRGFDGDLHLWPEWFRLIAACRPPVVVGEQVASKAGRAWLDLVLADLEGAGYTGRAFDLPAAGVGGPHARQRIYFIAYANERASEIIGARWLQERAVDAQVKLARAVDARDVAYAREGGCEILGTARLHDRGQLRHDAPGRGEADDGVPGTVPDAAVARPRVAQDAGADRGDALAGSEALEWRASGDLESQRDGADDDAANVVGPDGMGDAGLAGGGRDTGEVRREERDGEGERLEAGPRTDEPGAPGAAHDFRPGDRIRIADDPSWGGAVRGYWADDVEWVYCRPEPGHQDGRWRPARAGIEPLADGLASGVGRTRAKRLRGYGNALVRPLAVAFVEAVIDALAAEAVNSRAASVVTPERSETPDEISTAVPIVVIEPSAEDAA